MGAPIQGLQAAGDSSAEALLSVFKNIAPAEMRRHATVFNYWLSIRGDRLFPPIRDLDPLEISDAGPSSVLIEMVGGGEDGDIRHLGQSIKLGLSVEKMSDAPRPSLLSCILDKLPIVASSRQAFAFENEFEHNGGLTRCWVTLLPFSATGTWIDYVYGFVTLHPPGEGAEEASAVEVQAEPEAVVEAEPIAEEPVEAQAEPFEEIVEEVAELPTEIEVEQAPESEQVFDTEPEEVYETEPEARPSRSSGSGKPGFSAKIFESLAKSGFYGRVVEVDTDPEPEPASVLDIADQLIAEAEAAASEAEFVEPEMEVQAEPEPVTEVEPEPEVEAEMQPEPVVEVAQVEPEPAPEPEIVEQEAEAPVAKDKSRKPEVATEGTLQNKLTEVRAKADEARMAKLRANAALYDGLSAAYDFALDAEENAEEYLKLCEAQGLKIQLRSPMKPVVKLAFDGLCDDSTIAQLEAVLAWALKSDLPRGSLAQHIEDAGGIGAVLNGNGQAKAA